MMPLNCHFMAADLREEVAEMTLPSRNPPVVLPLFKSCAVAAGVREDTAENAKARSKRGAAAALMRKLKHLKRPLTPDVT